MSGEGKCPAFNKHTVDNGDRQYNDCTLHNHINDDSTNRMFARPTVALRAKLSIRYFRPDENPVIYSLFVFSVLFSSRFRFRWWKKHGSYSRLQITGGRAPSFVRTNSEAFSDDDKTVVRTCCKLSGERVTNMRTGHQLLTVIASLHTAASHRLRQQPASRPTCTRPPSQCTTGANRYARQVASSRRPKSVVGAQDRRRQSSSLS